MHVRIATALDDLLAIQVCSVKACDVFELNHGVTKRWRQSFRRANPSLAAAQVRYKSFARFEDCQNNERLGTQQVELRGNRLGVALPG